MEPNVSRVQEISFGDFIFYLLLNDRGDMMVIDDVEICGYHATWRPSFVNLSMRSVATSAAPAHVPNMVGNSDVRDLRRQLLTAIEDLPGVPASQTGFYDNIVDPLSIVNVDGPIYSLHREDTDDVVVYEVDVGISALGIVVVHRADNDGGKVKRFHRVQLKPNRG